MANRRTATCCSSVIESSKPVVTRVRRRGVGPVRRSLHWVRDSWSASPTGSRLMASSPTSWRCARGARVHLWCTWEFSLLPSNRCRPSVLPSPDSSARPSWYLGWRSRLGRSRSLPVPSVPRFRPNGSTIVSTPRRVGSTIGRGGRSTRANRRRVRSRSFRSRSSSPI